MSSTRPILRIRKLVKEFCLHLQNALRLPVFQALDFEVAAGEALAVTGPSGTGKSSLLKLIYGTYKAGSGEISVRHQGQWVDIAAAQPKQILAVRRSTIGYVPQFLRVIPRVAALDVVAEPLLERGMEAGGAAAQASALLARLAIPERLWKLSPLTFSGGEQQRVNIARGLAVSYPVLLLDEPTASLDSDNRARVLALINETRDKGATIIGVFHDAADRRTVCTRELDLGLRA